MWINPNLYHIITIIFFFFVYECEDNNYNIPMEIFMVDANLLIISIQMYMIDTYFR